MTIPRWKFHDPRGFVVDYTFPVNPSQMTPQQAGLTIDITSQTTMGGSNRDVQHPTPPMPWQFQGIFYTTDEEAAMYDWLLLAYPVELTDHFGYRFLVLPTDLDAVRVVNRRNLQRKTYTFHCLLLSRLS